MNDIYTISHKIYYRILVTKLIKFNIYNGKVFKLIKLPKIEDDLFKLSCFIKRGDVCIDVGANVGMYSTMCSKLCGTDGKVLAFEPIPEVFNHLRNNLNKMPNVQVYQMAVGENPDNVSLAYSFINGKVCDPLTRIATNKGDISMKPLDLVVQNAGLSRVDFLKIDVEGYELNVLKDSTEVIQKYHPIILMEIDDTWLERYNSSSEQIMSFLGSVGYKHVILQDCSFKITQEKVIGNTYFKWFK